MPGSEVPPVRNAYSEVLAWRVLKRHPCLLAFHDPSHGTMCFHQSVWPYGMHGDLFHLLAIAVLALEQRVIAS